jgi:hypothetical protein
MVKMEEGEAAKRVLCGANAYVEKYFLNPRFHNLPKDVQESLQKISVVFTEDIGGVFLMQFDEEGKLQIISIPEEGDYQYDTIGAELKKKKIVSDYKDLFSKLEEYYRGLLQIEKKESEMRNTCSN